MSPPLLSADSANGRKDCAGGPFDDGHDLSMSPQRGSLGLARNRSGASVGRDQFAFAYHVTAHA
jgi:hypothetical protein